MARLGACYIKENI